MQLLEEADSWEPHPARLAASWALSAAKRKDAQAQSAVFLFMQSIVPRLGGALSLCRRRLGGSALYLSQLFIVFTGIPRWKEKKR